MAFEQTWRWFGPRDPVSLKEIKQAGATGIVTALHQIPSGEIWPLDRIMERKGLIEAEGLTWSVAESIPVHEAIKQRSGGYRRLIDNYKESVRNLGKCGVDTVCYNFMPVLDWSRTNLAVSFRDGSITTSFEAGVFAAFDLYILQRPSASDEYSKEQAQEARAHFDRMSPSEKDQLTRTILLGLPGSGEAYTLAELRKAIAAYASIGEAGLRANLHSFIREIAPAAEESGVLLAIHPDDPPWSLLGLPRVVSNREDVEQLLGACDVRSNGLTLCTGSFGAGTQNDLVAMARVFARRISFIHLRNVSRNGRHDFLEENHLEGDIDLYGVMRELLAEQKRRIEEGRDDTRMPMRPDHGHLMLPDRERPNVYPGYSLFGRMRGLAELRGLELGIRRSLGW